MSRSGKRKNAATPQGQEVTEASPKRHKADLVSTNVEEVTASIKGEISRLDGMLDDDDALPHTIYTKVILRII